MGPEVIAGLMTPYWGPVALVVFMTFHFAWITRRDKSIEKRFSAQFDAIIEMEKERAAADLEQAKALTGLEAEVRFLRSVIVPASDPRRRRRAAPQERNQR